MSTTPDLAKLNIAASVMQSLPELMQAHREAIGIGTHLAAAACGMTQQNYWQIENRRTSMPNGTTILKVLRWLGASVEPVECTCLYFAENHEPRCFNPSLREEQLWLVKVYNRDLHECATQVAKSLIEDPLTAVTEKLKPSQITYVRGVLRRQVAKRGYRVTSAWDVSRHHRPRARREDIITPYTFRLYQGVDVP